MRIIAEAKCPICAPSFVGLVKSNYGVSQKNLENSCDFDHRVTNLTPLERLIIWNYWLVSRKMSVVFGKISP